MKWFKQIDKRLWEFAVPVVAVEIIGLIVVFIVYS